MEFDPKRFIRETKYELLQRSDVTKAFVKSRDMMLREIEAIRAKHASGLPVIPQVEYHDIVKGAVEEPFRDLVRRRGCVIVKGVFDRIHSMDSRASMKSISCFYFFPSKEACRLLCLEMRLSVFGEKTMQRGQD